MVITYSKLMSDEVPNRLLIKNLPKIVESNPNNEVYLVPRVNTVEGLTGRTY